MLVSFALNARQKEKHVARAVRGALRQTYPCEIVISDQCSTDRTLDEIRRAVHEFGPTHHVVKIVQCPIEGEYGIKAMNEHWDWLWKQTSGDWVFQCSADDESLPERVATCMEAIEHHPCSAIATTMLFEIPGDNFPSGLSGFPTETGYVKAGEGLTKLAYGSCIVGYPRDFLEKMDGKCGPNTPDVLYGFLAALDKGFYAIAEPHHIHCQHPDINNAGFGGKLLAATGDLSLILNELNYLQLMRLYISCIRCATDLYGAKIPEEDARACYNIIIGDAVAVVKAREILSAKGIQPGTL